MARALCLAVVAVVVASACAHRTEPEWRRLGANIWHHVDEAYPPTRAEEYSVSREDFEANDAVLKVSPDTFDSLDSVVVSWSGVDGASSSDWIAVYSPSYSANEEYVDYAWAMSSPTYMQGYGNITIQLVNMRTQYEFRYFKNNTQYILTAVSNLVSPNSENEPLHGRLALTGRDGEMRVMWVTNSSAHPPVVRYGLDPDALLFASVGASHTYTASDMCQDPATVVHPRTGYRDAGVIHDVLLAGLLPDTFYYYAFGNEHEGFSAVNNFTAPPLSLPFASRGMSFIAYGDMGESRGDGAVSTMQRTFEHVDEIDLVYHIGDISYARGAAYLWEWFAYFIQPVATRVPYMVGIDEYDHTDGGDKDPSKAPGNGYHPWWGNYGADSSGECAVPMVNRFHMPDNGNGIFWHSFDFALAHFVTLSSEHDCGEGSPQAVWLEADLAAVDRRATPWVVVGFHRPMYCSENYFTDYLVSLGLRAKFEDVLCKYRVNLVLTGHYHSYERTCPVYKEECLGDETSPKAPVHVMVGTAGADLDNADYYNVTWSVYHDQYFGYALVTAVDAHTLRLEYRHNHDDALFDKFTITHNYGLD